MARMRRTRAERERRRKERQSVDQNSDRLPSVGKGRFFEDPMKYKSDLYLIHRWGKNANWTDEQMQLAHANVARLAASEDPCVSLRAYDLMRKAVIDTMKAQLDLAKFDFAISQQLQDTQRQQQLHVGNNPQSDSSSSECSNERVLQIAQQLGIEITVSEPASSGSNNGAEETE